MRPKNGPGELHGGHFGNLAGCNVSSGASRPYQRLTVKIERQVWRNLLTR